MPIQSPSGFVQCPSLGAAPGREGSRPQRRVGDLRLQAAPAADGVQPDDHQRDQAGDDHEELQDLVVDGAGQAAEGDVGQHEGRRDHDRQPDRPADQRVDDQGQRVEVDPGGQHGGERERQSVEQVGRRVEPPAQELRDAAHPRAVVERHHHDAEEDHGRHRADPVKVHGGQAVLRAVGRHAQDLDRAQVGGDERETGHPRGQRPARQQEVLTGGNRPAGQYPDRHDQREVDPKDRPVKGVNVKPQHAHHLHVNASPPRARSAAPAERQPHVAQDESRKPRMRRAGPCSGPVACGAAPLTAASQCSRPR
jgi:hypothetical protein